MSTDQFPNLCHFQQQRNDFISLSKRLHRTPGVKNIITGDRLPTVRNYAHLEILSLYLSMELRQHFICNICNLVARGTVSVKPDTRFVEYCLFVASCFTDGIHADNSICSLGMFLSPAVVCFSQTFNGDEELPYCMTSSSSFRKHWRIGSIF